MIGNRYRKRARKDRALGRPKLDPVSVQFLRCSLLFTLKIGKRLDWLFHETLSYLIGTREHVQCCRHKGPPRSDVYRARPEVWKETLSFGES